MYLKILANGPYRVIIQLCVSSFKNRQFGATWADAFRVGCPNIPFSAQILKQISDDHQYAEDPFGVLADFKVILEKARKRNIYELLRETPSCLGAKL